MSEIQDEAYSEAMAEIERLERLMQRFSAERDSAIEMCEKFRQCLADKDAEIERLKEANLGYSSTVMTQEHEIMRLNALITELAEALSHYALLNDFEKGLLNQAREATK